MSDDDHVRQRRAELVEHRKREVDRVVDIHDSMLRELFHLQKFITLFGFDPEVAKQEKSEVWETFRKPFDLWDNHTSVGPSSRRTRRAITERRESLIPGASTSSTPTPARKGKAPDVASALRRASISNPGGLTLEALAVDNKGKGKSKSFAHPATPARAGTSSKKRPFPEEVDKTATEVDPDENLVDGVAALSVSSSPGPKSQKQKRGRKKSPGAPPSTPTAPFPSDSPSQSPGTTPLPKRIRLVVKPPPPPPIATHPSQLPRPRSFGGSLERLLASFALLEEGDEDDIPEPPSRGHGQMMIRPGEEEQVEKRRPVKIGITWDEFEQSVKEEVEVWARIEEMRRRGGLRCMRGWEIVRGEEDEEEEVDEEEGGGEEETGEGGENGGDLKDTRTPEAVEPAGTLLAEVTMSPRPMEIDTTDAHPAEPEPPEVLGSTTTLETTNAAVQNGFNGVEHSVIDGASSSLGLSGIEMLPPTAQSSSGTIESSAAPLDEAESKLSVEPMDMVDSASSQPAPPEPASSPFVLRVNAIVLNPSPTEDLTPTKPTTPTAQLNTPSTPTEPVFTVPLPLPAHPSLPPSFYATLLDSIPSHARFVKEPPLAHRHRVATLVARYWDRRQGAADRLIAAEERRVRAGAKALAKGVVAKAWKDAVAVIRARLKEQEEAEQAREGRKHLAAILEQSSALLETQQEDMGLSRRPGGRSRSASSGASSRARRPDSDDEEPEQEEGGGEGEGDGNESDASGETELEVEVEEEGGEEGEGSEMLLDLGSRGVSEDGGDGEDRDVDVVGLDDGEAGANNAMEEAETTADAPGDDAMSTTEDLVSFADILFTFEPDPMSIADSPAQSQVGTHQFEAPPRTGTLDSIEDEDMTMETVTRSSSTMDISTNGHLNPDADTARTPKANGHSHTPGTSPVHQATPLPAASEDLSSSAPTPSGVRKLTLKLKASTVDSPAPRRTSTSTPIAGAEDSDSEVDALAKEAEMPLEELMRRYGYVGVDEAQTSTPAEEVQSATADEVASARVVDSDGEDENEAGDEEMAAAEALLGPDAVESQQSTVVRPPFLLRGTLRPYQQGGLEWLVSGYTRKTNGILADEMGLGKTIQTISLLAHLACDRGIWGPHLIIVPTSVILNWEMEFKKFLPGFKVLSYYGSIKERKERRVGWNTEHSFNVVVTSYQLVLADQAIFRRKKWHYMILDEAHNIKNFKSQRWATLFSFNSERRLLLTGTPLQNNITELWSLLYFVQPDTANKQQFEEWFLETMRHAVETGDTMDSQTRDTIDKLHTVLRPYILRRLKADVERELPSKHEHIVYCRLSKRQRYLYDEFMSRAQTKETLAGGNFLSIVNCLMQLRKVCNHPDLFEVRPIVTSFAIPAGRSAVVDFEIRELLVRRRLLRQFDDDGFSVWNHSFDIASNAAGSAIVAERRSALNASQPFPAIEIPGEPPPKDLRTIAGNKRWLEHQRKLEQNQRRERLAYVNTQRNTRIPILGAEKLKLARSFVEPLLPADILEQQRPNPDTKFMAGRLVKSYAQREQAMGDTIDRFVFATPPVVALDLPRLTFGLSKTQPIPPALTQTPSSILHRTSVKLQIAFPDATLLQYDCGKLQQLDILLRSRHAGGHRVLIFTQMTRVLDILEIFLNLHGYRYLRLDGSTKIEQRQVVTERFNVDEKIFAFIASSRSGGVGINLTGADTVIFYDSDYNPSMDRQCEDRAHRIGQTREVNIYRFISLHTVEESMLRKANQKRLLDDIVIQQGEFDWRQVLVDDVRMERALAEVEDRVDVDAARMAAGEEQQMDMGDFGGGGGEVGGEQGENNEEEDDDGLRPIERYMLRRVEEDWEYFC
ncbi:swr1 complex component [Ceratobasidium sp. 395]|nr:swr1 complex component [Ceratobasidium sp. 395]